MAEEAILYVLLQEGHEERQCLAAKVFPSLFKYISAE
jgi:hypothetical protein